jgi:very-short-patch-repair endonuclease
LLAFAKEHGREVPQPLIAAASDPAVRQQIADSLLQIRAIQSPLTTENWPFLCRVFKPDDDVSVGLTLGTAPVEALTTWLLERIGDVCRIGEWIDYRVASERLQQHGLSPLLKEVLDGAVDLEEADRAFLVRFYRCWLDGVYAEDTSLGRFSVDEHEKLIERFRELDRDHIEESFKRIRMSQLKNGPGQYNGRIDAPGSSELGILSREVAKKRRHLPLRQLFKRIPWLLQRLKPCLMMSPLAVSTYLDSDHLRFDVVIFDEASQVKPHDAICAIYRGSQIVVAGDQKQLPPTSFFERQSALFDGDADDEEDADDIADFESILDVCTTLGLPRKRLRWHYRSKRESLIAFSNENFYDQELVTFPSVRDVDGDSAVRLEFLKNGRWQAGTSGGFNTVEAHRAAEMVMEHAKTTPDRSLGVITMNQRQQLLVVDEIEKCRHQHPELEEFFSDAKKVEPFFVKNLENVKGDERDVIFLSVGYAQDQNGNLAMRFGPLNAEGGERRLNVAVTRARYSLTVVSSIGADDIDLARTNAVGVKLLKAYLDYAKRGVEALKSVVDNGGSHAADSPFEEEVARELRKRGLQVRLQVGCGGFRIDLALVDPKQPGRYVLGIECDGATYHSSATARDRDRLRQSVLEELGWHICRIWSTDWVRDRERQVRRVMAAYETALKDPAEEGAPTIASQRRAAENGQPVPKVEPQHSNGLPQFNYNSIEEVPSNHIEALILGILRQFGATESDELVVNVARHLGFARTGSKISKRIENCLRSLRRRGSLGQDEDRRVRAERSDK